MAATEQTTFDVFITAGYNPAKADALTQAEGVHHKALIPIAGKPMVWHVVRALVESGYIGEIVIVGLGPEYGVDFGDASVHYVPNQPSLWASQNAGLRKLQELNPEDRIVLAASADTPLLTGEMVRAFIDACRPFDRSIYWGIVRQDVMEATFPLSKRSYLPLREGKFCSGDLYLGWLSAGLKIQDRARYFIDNRKHVVKQVWGLGLGPLLRLLFHRLSIDEILDIAVRTLGVTGGPVILPFAEVGMDVDKPHQLEQVRAYLQAHPEHPANTRTS